MKKLTLLPFILCLLLIASCGKGGSDSDSAAGSPDTTTPAVAGPSDAGDLNSALESFANALSGGDASSTGSNESFTGGNESFTGGNESFTGGGESSTGGSESFTGGSESFTGSGESSTGGGQPSSGAGSFSLDSFAGEDNTADTLHDPGPLVGAKARQIDDAVIDGVNYQVYVYDFDGASGIKLNFYSSALEDEGYAIEKTDTDGDTTLYAITGPDGVAVLRVYSPLIGTASTWTLYVPDGMAFTPGGDSGSSTITGSSFQNGSYLGGSSAITGSSFQNGSYLGGSSAITGSSFQNESYLANAKDPIVVDGMLICTDCNGSGLCRYCGGTGSAKYDMHNYETCIICDGSGKCDVCGGTGNWGPA